MVAYKCVGSAAGPDWLATQSPQLTKAITLPSNTLPDMLNMPCQQLSTITNNQSVQDCIGGTTLGPLSARGKGLYVDDQTVVPVLLNGGNIMSFLPTPGSFETLAISYSTGTIWNYAGFYTNLQRGDLADKQISTGFLQFQRQFWVSRGPDYYLTGSTGTKLLLNSQAMAFSPNGQWLVVDSSNGMLRIDLSDPVRPITPFAPALEVPGSHGLANAQLAITNDGRYAAISVHSNPYGVDPNLKVYDLSGCSGAPDLGGCKVRDLWSGPSGIGHSLTTPAAPGNLRFIDNTNLSFNDEFNQVGSNYDAATFVVTAPGGSLHGLGLLALGDSYISGEGEFMYMKSTDTDINHCHESFLSYPYLLGAESFTTYDSVACSGAVTNDITTTSSEYKGQAKDGIKLRQRNAASILQQFMPGYIGQEAFIGTYKPEVILLSIGGNDMGFDSIVKSCVAHFQLVNPFDSTGFENTCYASYEDRYELMRSIDKKFDTLVQTYQDIKTASPTTHIYVVGYPQIVEPGGSCALNVRLDKYETQFASDAISYIDDVIHRAANKAGIVYVDTSHAFDGHKLCDATADAVNGLAPGDDEYGIIGHESYHPTVLGHRLLAQAIDAATNHLSVAMPTAQPNITAPQPSGTEILLTDAPEGKSNRHMYSVSMVPNLIGALVRVGQAITLNVAGLLSNFASNSVVTVRIGPASSAQAVGVLQTDANGDITNGQITVPAAVPAGYATVHLYGKDLAGNDIDVQQDVFVAASSDDYDGDSVPNAQDACPYIPNSGVDYDQDGIDDACDPEITSPPSPDQGESDDANTVASSTSNTTDQNPAPGDAPGTTKLPMGAQQLQHTIKSSDTGDLQTAPIAQQASQIIIANPPRSFKSEVLGVSIGPAARGAATAAPTVQITHEGVFALPAAFLAAASLLVLLLGACWWICRCYVYRG